MLLKLLFIFLQFGASLQASFSVGNENETIQILQKRQGPPGKHFVGYFIEWGIYDRDYQPSDIPGDKLTHINYAFANLEESGEVVLGDAYAATEKMYPGDTDGQPFKGALNQLLNVVRPTYPDLRVLLSIGGWTWSEKFSIVAADEGKRQTFAQSCKSIIDKFGFDGIDVDWEYPVEGGLPTNVYSPNDGANYVLLLQALRGAIGDKLITVAGPAGPHLTKHLDMSGMASVLDFINIMTYDFRGGWSQFTGHQAPLFASSTDPDKSLTDTSTVVDVYINSGMPANKICIGAAIYGRGWSGVPADNNGLFQSFASVPQGTWDDGTSGATGVFDYKDVMERLRSGQATRFWDSEVHAAWLYGADGTMISYDDVQSVTDKCNFVNDKQLAGIMVWELSGDDQSDSLVSTIFQGLSGGGGGGDGGSPPPPSDPNPPPPSDPNPPPSNDPPGPPSGSAGCGQTGESCSSNTGCSGDQLLMCNGGTWTGMPCAPGTVCRVSDGQGFCVEASTPGYQAC